MEFNYNNYSNSKLQHILAIYSNDNNSTIEHYRVTDNVTELPQAYPLSVSSAKQIFNQINISEGNNFSFNGMIPKNVLYVNQNQRVLIWKQQSTQCELFFENKFFKDGLYPMPTIVFKLEEDKLYIYATKTNNINQNTELFHAPFLNVYHDGSICMGSASLEIEECSYYEEVMQLASYNFFNSKFTHTNYDASTSENIIDVYEKSYNQKTFNKKFLNPINLKLKDLWKC